MAPWVVEREVDSSAYTKDYLFGLSRVIWGRIWQSQFNSNDARRVAAVQANSLGTARPAPEPHVGLYWDRARLRAAHLDRRSDGPVERGDLALKRQSPGSAHSGQ